MLIITYSEMGTIANGSTYWASSLCRKLNYPTLGFVGKGPNWFPSKCMNELASKAEICELLRHYTIRLGYGFSMGGYACIKYQRLLGVNQVLAVSPQYSIDPRDTKNIDNRFSHYYNHIYHQDMAINSDDFNDETIAIIAYDPRDLQDSWNAKMILKTGGSSCIPIHLRGTGHFSIRAISNSKTMQKIFMFMKYADYDKVKYNLNKQRKKWPGRAAILAKQLALKNPQVAFIIAEYHSRQFYSHLWGPAFSSIGFVFASKKSFYFADYCAMKSIELCGENLHNLQLLYYSCIKSNRLIDAYLWISKSLQIDPERTRLQELREDLISQDPLIQQKIDDISICISDKCKQSLLSATIYDIINQVRL